MSQGDIANGSCSLPRHCSPPPSCTSSSLSTGSQNFDDAFEASLGSFDYHALKMLEKKLDNIDLVTVCDEDDKVQLEKLSPPPATRRSTSPDVSAISEMLMDPPVFRRSESEQPALNQTHSFSSSETTSTTSTSRRRQQTHLHLLEEGCQQTAAEAAQKRAELLRSHLLEEDVQHDANEITNSLKRWYANKASSIGSSRPPSETGSSASTQSSSVRMSTNVHDRGGEGCPPPASTPSSSRRRYGEEKWELLEEDALTLDTVDEPDDLDATSVQHQQTRRRMSQLLATIPDMDANSDDYQRQCTNRRSSTTEYSVGRSTTSSQESPFPVLYVGDVKRPAEQRKDQYATITRDRQDRHRRSRDDGSGSDLLLGPPANAGAGMFRDNNLKTGAQPRTAGSKNFDYKQRTRVRFSELQIRQYERILGDNPSCSSGPSLSIGWSYDKTNVLVLDVDEFEDLRYDNRIPGKYCRDFMVSRDSREALLKSLGYSTSDLAKAVRKNVKAQNQRKQTTNNLALSKVEELMEGMNKSLRKGIVGKRDKKKDKRGTNGEANGVEAMTREKETRSGWRTKSGRLKGGF